MLSHMSQRATCCVQGKFTYGVMGVAAATFLFWSGVGTRLFPQASNCLGRASSVGPGVVHVPLMAGPLMAGRSRHRL